MTCGRFLFIFVWQLLTFIRPRLTPSHPSTLNTMVRKLGSRSLFGARDSQNFSNRSRPQPYEIDYLSLAIPSLVLLGYFILYRSLKFRGFFSLSIISKYMHHTVKRLYKHVSVLHKTLLWQVCDKSKTQLVALKHSCQNAGDMPDLILN